MMMIGAVAVNTYVNVLNKQWQYTWLHGPNSHRLPLIDDRLLGEALRRYSNIFRKFGGPENLTGTAICLHYYPGAWGKCPACCVTGLTGGDQFQDSPQFWDAFYDRFKAAHSCQEKQAEAAAALAAGLTNACAPILQPPSLNSNALPPTCATHLMHPANNLPTDLAAPPLPSISTVFPSSSTLPPRDALPSPGAPFHTAIPLLNPSANTAVPCPHTQIPPLAVLQPPAAPHVSAAARPSIPPPPKATPPAQAATPTSNPLHPAGPVIPQTGPPAPTHAESQYFRSGRFRFRPSLPVNERPRAFTADGAQKLTHFAMCGRTTTAVSKFLGPDHAAPHNEYFERRVAAAYANAMMKLDANPMPAEEDTECQAELLAARNLPPAQKSANLDVRVVVGCVCPHTVSLFYICSLFGQNDLELCLLSKRTPNKGEGGFSGV